MMLSFIGCGDKNTDDELELHHFDRISILKESFGGFYFAGMYNKKAAVYKYNAAEKKHSLFWSHPFDRVIEMSFSPDKSSAYFITARKFSQYGQLPYFERAKLYMIDKAHQTVRLIENLGTGLQIFTGWDSDSLFKLTVNSIDKTIATNVLQSVFLFNLNGEEVGKETQTFDITIDGYPGIPKKKVLAVSPDSLFAVVPIEEVDSIYLFNLIKNKKKIISAGAKKVTGIGWLKNSEMAVINLIGQNHANGALSAQAQNISSLIVYSVKGKKILKKWEGEGIKNFFVVNKFLIFDDGFGENSSISIFDLFEMKLWDKITIPGGVGLINIPLPNELEI
jgi:hypothetical protein